MAHGLGDGAHMQRFPVRLPALWRQAFPGVMAGAVAGQALGWLQGEPFSWPQSLPLMAVAAITVVLVHLLMPTEAGPEGLKLGTFWGWRRDVAWEDIASAEHLRGVPLVVGIRLRDRQGRSYLLPRDTVGLPALHALARSRGGPEHPLTRALEMPMYRL